MEELTNSSLLEDNKQDEIDATTKVELTDEQKAAIAEHNATAVGAIFNKKPTRYELKPIGVYGDYSENPNKCSWYYVENRIMYLFDCPLSNVMFIMSKAGQKVLSHIDKIDIFITSLKESRVGGLKTFIDVLVSMDMDYIVYFPPAIWIKGCNYMEVVGTDMKDSHVVKGDYFQDDNVQIFPREVVHDNLIRSFAYMIYGGDLFINHEGTNWSAYYSPDNRIFMDDSVLKSFLSDPREKTIYHGVTLSIEDETHCYKDRITQVVPKKLRERIHPMNLDKPAEFNKLKTLGLTIPEV